MVIVGIVFLLFFPIWGLWIIFSLRISNSLITPITLYRRIVHHFHFEKNRAQYHTVLYSKLSYFQKLDSEQQIRFLNRVKKFIANKRFIPVEIVEVSPIDKLLVASSAIQLTFGLEEFVLSRFEHVYIYPKYFYNRRAKAHHKGEVNVRGSISLSLHDFHLGYQNEKDGINLGLHEMAHALKVEQFLEQDTEDFFNIYFAKVSKEMDYEITNDSNNDFIREYGKSNKNEFFAVCIENFFERPLKFKEVMPELYAHFVVLLNQDPLQVGFSLEEGRTTDTIEDLNIDNLGEVKIEKGISLNYISLIGSILYVIIAVSTFKYAIFLPLVVLLLTFLGYKTTTIHEKGIGIKRWYSKRVTYFPYSKIVLVLLPEGDIQKFMIKYRTGSIIKSKMIDVKLNEEEKTILLGLLQSKKVSTRLVGGFK